MDALEQITRLLSVADNMVTPNTKYVVGPETAIVEVIWEEHASSYASVKMIKDFFER
jgi:apolipoprotein N-acyltransferase